MAVGSKPDADFSQRSERIEGITLSGAPTSIDCPLPSVWIAGGNARLVGVIFARECWPSSLCVRPEIPNSLLTEQPRSAGRHKAPRIRPDVPVRVGTHEAPALRFRPGIAVATHGVMAVRSRK